MNYEINVSLHGQHFFATAERSITDLGHLTAVLRTFRQSFKSDDGFVITVTKWQTTGQGIDLDTIDPPTPPVVEPALTHYEKRVLKALREDAEGNGGDFGIIENIEVRDLGRQSLAVVIESLQAKGLITVHDAVLVNGGTRVTQFTFNQ